MRIDLKIWIIFFSAFLLSCSKPVVEKPEKLIHADKMVNMLVDVHIAEAAFNNRRVRDSLVMKSSSVDFYYSVLAKYEVPDSVFEKSLVFYASQPRKFEKMYRKVMNKLNEQEHEYSGRKVEAKELDF